MQDGCIFSALHFCRLFLVFTLLFSVQIDSLVNQFCCSNDFFKANKVHIELRNSWIEPDDIILGQIWHLTHRCHRHKREFLLKINKGPSLMASMVFQAKKTIQGLKSSILCMINP